MSRDPEPETDDCSSCDGSGLDAREDDGRCIFCGGSGRVKVTAWDEEAAPRLMEVPSP